MNIEILAPAGNMEKLNTAFYYGADACYFAGTKLGLRAYAGNFKDDELKTSVEYAHSLGKKAYITINVIAHNPDFDELKDYVLYLYSIGVDAVICADIGIIKFIRDVCPDMNIHVSTQANITNKYKMMPMQIKNWYAQRLWNSANNSLPNTPNPMKYDSVIHYL